MLSKFSFSVLLNNLFYEYRFDMTNIVETALSLDGNARASQSTTTNKFNIGSVCL